MTPTSYQRNLPNTSQVWEAGMQVKITNPNNTFTQYIKNIPSNPTSMFMTPTSKIEIERIIEKLPNKTSKGHDDISNILLKKIKTAIS